MTYRDVGRLGWRFEFKPADCWIGVFWSRGEDEPPSLLHVWVCLLPMLPLHLVYQIGRKGRL
jgi:hypothetical protein